MTRWFRVAGCCVSCCFALLLLTPDRSTAADPSPEVLPGTERLSVDRPLDVLMVEGIDRHAMRAIEASHQRRDVVWQSEDRSRAALDRRLEAKRARLREIIGAVDTRPKADDLELIVSATRDALIAENEQCQVFAVRWPVLENVSAEGLWLRPRRDPVARVIALPDADWTPEMIAGLAASDTAFALELVACGCEVLIPTLISRDDQWSGNPENGRFTNQPHREFIYRQAFEVGRHVIGYEVQKVLAAVDQFESRNRHDSVEIPILVMGVREGGLLASYSGALDTRIDGVVVSGHFDQRDGVWSEPIYRNVWSLLNDFGDAELAAMVCPRPMYVEACPEIADVTGPPERRDGRSGAAPGALRTPARRSVLAEVQRAERVSKLVQNLADDRSHIAVSPMSADGSAPLSAAVVRESLRWCGVPTVDVASPPAMPLEPRVTIDEAERQRRQVDELVRFTQGVLRLSHRERERRFRTNERLTLDAWNETADRLRVQVHDELIGRLPTPTMPPRPRTRQVFDEPEFTGYEVVLDVFPEVIAAGVLLLPKGISANERRPVVVCQHGLEGTPYDTIGGPGSAGYGAYKAFSAELARRGFIVYAPQNPYRGQDAFRVLQRKANVVGRSLFSYIIPQHLVTLRWLATLPQVDVDRIAFYGLSYGGKTAMRVPPLLPPSSTEPGYCLSICSADFNEWVAKNASYDAPFSYLYTGEYEIFEWNMGHVANYAELAMLMVPRPFMVERGHDDGVGIDEWVAWEFAKVRRHYSRLGLGDRTEIEFFDGPHTINGQATYEFLHRHLNWARTEE